MTAKTDLLDATSICSVRQLFPFRSPTANCNVMCRLNLGTGARAGSRDEFAGQPNGGSANGIGEWLNGARNLSVQPLLN